MMHSVSQEIQNIINAHYSKDWCVFSEAEGLKAIKVFFFARKCGSIPKEHWGRWMDVAIRLSRSTKLTQGFVACFDDNINHINKPRD